MDWTAADTLRSTVTDQCTTIQHWQLRDLIHAHDERALFCVDQNRTLQYDTVTNTVCAMKSQGSGFNSTKVVCCMSWPWVTALHSHHDFLLLVAVPRGADAHLCADRHDGRARLRGRRRPEQLCALRLTI